VAPVAVVQIPAPAMCPQWCTQPDDICSAAASHCAAGQTPVPPPAHLQQVQPAQLKLEELFKDKPSGLDGLECTHFGAGHVMVKWHIQQSSLSKLLSRLMSPTFEVGVPNFGKQTFKMMLLPVECQIGSRKNRNTFHRSRGKASLVLKCTTENLPEEFPELSIRMGLSVPGNVPTDWRPRRPLVHSFAESSCASLPEELSEWDIRSVLGSEACFTMHAQIELRDRQRRPTHRRQR